VVDLAAAYASCERDAREHYENFPVASALIPSAMRRHIAAVYAFARAADDFADEGERSDADRLGLLDRWEARLRDAAADTHARPLVAGEPANAVEIFSALSATIREYGLPPQLFLDLLSAFRQDVGVTRYPTWESLLEYCSRSANPVGRLVLRIAGIRDARLDEYSDAICTALQLTNFWQDLGRDLSKGRIYLPLEELRAHGAGEADLRQRPLPAGARGALQSAVARTRALFAAGRGVCDSVRGRLRYELRATWLGGMRILERLEAGGFDPIERRPRLESADAAWIAWRLLRWRARARRSAELERSIVGRQGG
jgi:squalene synthase HpnC